MSMIERQNKTADGLRSRLFDMLDKVIDGKAKSAEVAEVCLLSQEILDTARLELDTAKERARMIIEERDSMSKATAMLTNTVSLIEDSIQEAELEEI